MAWGLRRGRTGAEKKVSARAREIARGERVGGKRVNRGEGVGVCFIMSMRRRSGVGIFSWAEEESDEMCKRRTLFFLYIERECVVSGRWRCRIRGYGMVRYMMELHS
jgi:hypothetical protein